MCKPLFVSDVAVQAVAEGCYPLRHLIEPRFDEFKSASEKLAAFKDYNIQDLTLKHFRGTLGTTPVMAAGGFGPDNFEDGLLVGEHDLMAFGRFFVYVSAVLCLATTELY